MKPERHAIQVKEAWARIETHIGPLPFEEVGLGEAWGRHLAETVTAGNALPHFRRSGMDGFAVRTADIQDASPEHPVSLKVVDSIPCGSVPSCDILAGQASRIMTGAMVPENADAVIMLEMTRERVTGGQAYIEVAKSIRAGSNISEIGSELLEGTEILESGRNLRAGELAILASFGYARVPVYRKPKVALIATGSELLELHEPLVPGKIRNSNISMLAAQVKQYGGEPILLGTVADRKEEAAALIGQAFAKSDLVLTTGGVSVGDYDILTDIFSEWQGTVLFNKLAMRPGSPTTAGIRDGKFLFALSGNPGACFVAFELLVRPVLLGMQGAAKKFLPECTACLAHDFVKVNAYTRYVRGMLYAEDGRLFAEPVNKDQSGILASVKDANCLLVIPPGGQGKKAGERVSVLLLQQPAFRICGEAGRR